MKVQKRKRRRCDYKENSPEGDLLKFLRESRAMSTRQVAKMLGISASTVSHTENGRRDLDQVTLRRFLNIYGYEVSEFKEMLKQETVIPEYLRSQCIEVLKRLSISKLKTVKLFLDAL